MLTTIITKPRRRFDMRAIFEVELGLMAPDVKATDVRTYIRDKGEANQALADAQMEIARLDKAAKKKGINLAAMKVYFRLKKQNQQKSETELAHTINYLRVGGFWEQGELPLAEKEPTEEQEQPEAESLKNAQQKG